MQARNHVDIMESLGLIDFDRASAVAGSKFYYLRGAAALLEIALVNLAIQVHSCPLPTARCPLPCLHLRPGEQAASFSIRARSHCVKRGQWRAEVRQ